MKIKYLKFKNWLLMSVMGLFGLTACHSSKEAAQNQVKNDEPAPEVKPRGDTIAETDNRMQEIFMQLNSID